MRWKIGCCSLSWEPCLQLRYLSRVLAGQGAQLTNVPGMFLLQEDRGIVTNNLPLLVSAFLIIGGRSNLKLQCERIA